MGSAIRSISTLTLMMVLAAAMAGCPSGGDASGDGAPSSNKPPVISGAPMAAIVFSNGYSFTPNASDANGDPLTFSIENKPLWADFSGTNGALTGTPTMGDIGTYTNIGISVSDGKLSSSLPQFSVTVLQNADGTITLSWTAPTQNEDGTALTDLAAYKFYYGTLTGVYTDEVRIDNPGLTTYIIENLVPTTYYIVATAINNAGAESAFSNEAVKRVL